MYYMGPGTPWEGSSGVTCPDLPMGFEESWDLEPQWEGTLLEVILVDILNCIR